MLVAERDDVKVGYASAAVIADVADLTRAAVRPFVRRSGPVNVSNPSRHLRRAAARMLVGRRRYGRRISGRMQSFPGIVVVRANRSAQCAVNL